MQSDSLTLRFHLARFPVVIEPTFWVSMILSASNLRGPSFVLWILVVFLSILTHELGHAVAARAFGARASIAIHALGGLTFPDRTLPRNQSLVMTLAGPAAGFALAGLVWLLRHELPMVARVPHLRTFLRDLFTVNLGLSLFNLLPIPPLDGGHAALLVAGPRRERTVRQVAVAVAALVVVWGISVQSIFVVLLVGLAGFRNYQALRERSR
jgi:stage IV sporulation protein FB